MWFFEHARNSNSNQMGQYKVRVTINVFETLSLIRNNLMIAHKIVGFLSHFSCLYLFNIVNLLSFCE